MCVCLSVFMYITLSKQPKDTKNLIILSHVAEVYWEFLGYNKNFELIFQFLEKKVWERLILNQLNPFKLHFPCLRNMVTEKTGLAVMM